jgi:hypothetical protein
MSLDKWLGKEEEEEEEEEQAENEVDTKQVSDNFQKTLLPSDTEELKGKEEEKRESSGAKLTKYLLSCSNSKCEYKKTLMKRELTSDDKVCPRCKSDMNVRKG